MKKIITRIIAALTLTSVFAYGVVLGGSNLPLWQGYPAFSAMKPYIPSFSSTVSEWEYDSTRSSVVDFVDEAETYIDNAYNDIERIKDEIESARDAANSAVNEFNSWSRSVTVTKSGTWY